MSTDYFGTTVGYHLPRCVRIGSFTKNAGLYEETQIEY
jgi:hypothetical protein